MTSFGESLVLVATVTNAAGQVLTNQTVTWSVDDQAVLSLAANQPSPDNSTVTAVANGVGNVTATAGGLSASASVQVDQQLAALIVLGATAVEFSGDTAQFTSTGTDARGNQMTHPPVTWSSADALVATADADGLVTARGFGTSDISVTVAGISNTIQFEVIGDRFFLNGNVRLRYDLDLPPGDGPFPAVVWVHGSGRQDRNAQRIGTDPLVPEGLAALRYDKRGVGESTGTFFNVGPQNSQVLNTLAGDTVAAIRFLERFPQIDPNRRGIMGNSQGGWIAPIAASMANEVSFMMLWSGPTVSVGREIFYSGLADGTDTPLDNVYAQLGSFNGFAGHEPMPLLRTLNIPSLWLYGELDRSIPSRLDVRNMQTLQAAGLPYEFIVYPNAGHDLRNPATGRFYDLWSDYLAWMRRQGILF